RRSLLQHRSAEAGFPADALSGSSLVSLHGRTQHSTATHENLRPQPVHQPRKRYALPDMRRTANPRYGSLQPQPEARVREGAVLSQVQVPAVCIHRQALFLDAPHESVVVIFTLRPADDLAVALRRQAVVA